MSIPAQKKWKPVPPGPTLRTEPETHLRRPELPDPLRILGTLSGGMAHDLNNSLFTILGYTRLALDDLAPDCEASRFLREVVAASERASGLVDQVLRYRGADRRGRSVANLPNVLEGIAILLRSGFRPGLTVERDILRPAPEAAVPENDARRLLLGIATDLCGAVAGRRAMLTIRLESLAVESADQSRVYQVARGEFLAVMFELNCPAEGGVVSGAEHLPASERLPRDFSVSEDVRHAVERYGGSVTAEILTECTTRVWALFPQCTPPVELKTLDAPGFTGQSVALLEPDTAVSALMTRWLEQMGLSVVACNQPDDAWRVVEQPDREVTALIMSSAAGSDADAVAARIGEHHPEVAIVYVSGAGNSPPVNASAHLPKPTTAGEFEGTIRGVIAAARERKEQ